MSAQEKKVESKDNLCSPVLILDDLYSEEEKRFLYASGECLLPQNVANLDLNLRRRNGRGTGSNLATIHFFPEKLSIAPKSPKSPQYGKQLGDIIKNLTLTSETLQNEKEQEMIKKTFDVYKRILLEAYCPRTMIIQRIGKQKMCSYYSLLSLYLLTHRTN